MNEKLKQEADIEKKDHWNCLYQEDINKLKDDINGKNLAIEALSQTLLDKGDENQKLSEMIGQLKNHLLHTKTFD